MTILPQIEYCPTPAALAVDRLTAFAERCGIWVVPSKTMPDGVLGWSAPETGLIAIEATLPPDRRLEVIAHELTHVLDAGSHDPASSDNERAPQLADYIISTATGHPLPNGEVMTADDYVSYRDIVAEVGYPGASVICQLYQQVCPPRREADGRSSR